MITPHNIKWTEWELYLNMKKKSENKMYEINVRRNKMKKKNYTFSWKTKWGARTAHSWVLYGPTEKNHPKEQWLKNKMKRIKKHKAAHTRSVGKYNEKKRRKNLLYVRDDSEEKKNGQRWIRTGTGTYMRNRSIHIGKHWILLLGFLV